MLRCRESAKILFPKQSISVVSDLRECDFGRYENKNFDFSACSILQFLFYLRRQLYRQLIQYGFPNAQCRESKPQFIRFGITQTVFVRAERNKIDAENISSKDYTRFEKIITQCDSDGYETVTSSNEENEIVRILMKIEKEKIREIVIISLEENEISLIRIKGKIDPNQMQNIIEDNA